MTAELEQNYATTRCSKGSFHSLRKEFLKKQQEGVTEKTRLSADI